MNPKVCSLIFSLTSIVTVVAQDEVLSPSPDVSIADALKAIKKTLYDERAIKEFFHEHVMATGNETYCSKPSNCADLYYAGFRRSGEYKIYLKPWMVKREIKVYCDMQTDGGGWTIFQRREENEVQINFTKSWSDYRHGFGDLSHEFWLGNENIHLLSTHDNVALRIDLHDFDGNSRFATYDDFEVADEADKFKMRVGKYKGDAGDCFGFTNGLTFSTIDQDNEHKCSQLYRGGWWYAACHSSNLNGRYLRGNHTSYADGIDWACWRGAYYSLRWVEMKIRPKKFT